MKIRLSHGPHRSDVVSLACCLGLFHLFSSSSFPHLIFLIFFSSSSLFFLPISSRHVVVSLTVQYHSLTPTGQVAPSASARNREWGTGKKAKLKKGDKRETTSVLVFFCLFFSLIAPSSTVLGPHVCSVVTRPFDRHCRISHRACSGTRILCVEEWKKKETGRREKEKEKGEEKIRSRHGGPHAPHKFAVGHACPIRVPAHYYITRPVIQRTYTRRAKLGKAGARVYRILQGRRQAVMQPWQVSGSNVVAQDSDSGPDSLSLLHACHRHMLCSCTMGRLSVCRAATKRT